VVIQLSQLTFPSKLDPSAIDISEAKHNRNVKDLMEWSVDPERKRLTIQFRPGAGDFGSGNRVEVKIRREVFQPGSQGALIWVVETDPL
jgi:hypothetical protein